MELPIDKLARQLGMSMGDAFKVKGIEGKYLLTKDGIIYDNMLISQQQLIHILFGSCVIRKED